MVPIGPAIAYSRLNEVKKNLADNGLTILSLSDECNNTPALVQHNGRHKAAIYPLLEDSSHTIRSIGDAQTCKPYVLHYIMLESFSVTEVAPWECADFGKLVHNHPTLNSWNGQCSTTATASGLMNMLESETSLLQLSKYNLSPKKIQQSSL